MPPAATRRIPGNCGASGSFATSPGYNYKRRAFFPANTGPARTISRTAGPRVLPGRGWSGVTLRRLDGRISRMVHGRLESGLLLAGFKSGSEVGKGWVVPGYGSMLISDWGVISQLDCLINFGLKKYFRWLCNMLINKNFSTILFCLL